MPQKIIKPLDFAVIAVIALSALIAASPIIAYGRDSASGAVITYDGGTLEINLSQDRVFEIESHGVTLEITVADGSVAVTNADCPDRLCAGQGKINRGGQVIICIPAKTLIEIKGGEAYADEIAG